MNPPARLAVCLLFFASATVAMSGCQHSVAATIKVGMTGDEVRQRLGEPLITGRITNSIPGQQMARERWTYVDGHDGLVMMMDGGRVSQITKRPSTMPALRAKVREGMTETEVLATLGKPVNGLEGGMHPNAIWIYGDPVAPVETLMITFEGSKVKTAHVTHNSAYR